MEAKHGGARPGAGRPALEEKRTLRSMRAYDDEWVLIQKFAGLVKAGRIDECRKVVEEILFNPLSD